MTDVAAAIEIPNRALFKASEVCELLKVQPYVLKSWEAEFPDLGVVKTAGAARVYRRGDVERVVHIRHLLLIEGLTLAGARRRIEEQAAPVIADEPTMDELFGRNARQRLTAIRRGLRSLLDLLSGSPGAAPEFRLASPDASASSVRRSTSVSAAEKPLVRGKTLSKSAAVPVSKRKRS